MNKPTLYYWQYTQCLLVSKSDLHQSPCLPRECTTQGWLCTAPVWAKHRHMTKQRQWVRTQTAAPPWSDVRGLEGGYAIEGDTRMGRLSIWWGWSFTDTNETGWTGPLSKTFCFPYVSATEIKIRIERIILSNMPEGLELDFCFESFYIFLFIFFTE